MARPARTDRIRASEADFLRHPRGLTFLLTTEMWERFSYYGMRALLVLDRYLTRSLEAGLPFEPLFVLALFTLIPGNGAFRPNTSTEVGGLYAPGDYLGKM